MNGKKIVAGAMAVAMAASLAACSGGSGAADGKIELNVLSYDLESQDKAMFDAFEKANPDIKLKVSYTTTNYAQTLQTRISGNQTPDVFKVISDNVVDIKNNEVSMDLSGESLLDGIDESYLQTFEKDGKIYAMPTQAWQGFLVYNKDLVSKAGYDEFPTEWDDFIKLGKKLKSDGVPYPFLEGQDGRFSYTFEALLGSKYKMNGETNVDTKIANGETTFEEEYTPVLKEWKKVIDEGVLTKDSLSLTGDALNQAFVSGELAMYTTGIWDAATLQKSGINYGVAPFPAYPGGEPFIVGAADQAWAISASASKEKQEAGKKLLAFINSAEGLKLYCEGNGYASISSVYSSPVAEGFENIDETMKKGNMFWSIFQKNPSPITTEQIAKTQEMIQGSVSPEDLAKSLDEKMQS